MSNAFLTPPRVLLAFVAFSKARKADLITTSCKADLVRGGFPDGS